MSLRGKRRPWRLKSMAEPEPELDRRRIRVPAGQAPDPGQVAALVAQGYTFAHTARVGWGASDELDYWYVRPAVRTPPRPIYRRRK
jgi:hypothetical protein